MKQSSNNTLLKSLIDSPSFRNYSEFYKKKNLLRPSQIGTGSTFSDLDLPIAFSNTGHVAYRDFASLKCGTGTISSPGTWNTTGLLNASSASMLGTFYNGFFYYGVWSGASGEIRKIQLSTSANTLVCSIPETFVGLGDSTLAVRVESVAACANGVVFAVGFHRFDDKLSTIRFYFLKTGDSTPVLLNSFVQCPVDPLTVFTSYFAMQRGLCPVFCADLGGGKTLVVGSDHYRGRAVHFTIAQNGVESAMEAALPIDTSVSDISFLPTGLAYLTDKWILSGQMVRRQSDGTSVSLNGYLATADGKSWSHFEISSFVSAGPYPVSVVQPDFVDGRVWFVGPGKSYRADLRESEVGAPLTEITDSVDGWQFSVGSNGVASLELEADSSLLTDPLESIQVKAGYYDGASKIGVTIGEFVPDLSPGSVSGGILNPSGISAVDFATYLLKYRAANIDADLWSSTREYDDLSKAGQFVYKTPFYSAVHGTDGLVTSELNRPLIAYKGSRDERDGMLWAKIKFGTTSPECQSGFGFIFGGGDKNFNAATITKNTTWGSKKNATPGFWTSNLDPDAPFSLKDRLAGVWKSFDTDSYREVLKPFAAGGLVTYSLGNFATPEVEYQLALRISGSRAQLFRKIFTSNNSQIASNASWTLQASIQFNQFARKQWDSRYGFVIGHDVWSSKTAFGDSYEDGIVSGLTNASNFTDWARTLTTGVGPNGSTTLGQVASTANISVGMMVRVNNNVRKITSIVGSLVTLDGTHGLGVNDSYSVLGNSLGDVWGNADTSYKKTSAGGVPVISGDTTVKLPNRSGGKAFFVSDDTTAGSERYCETDGVLFDLFEGNSGSGGLYWGWDPTTPVGNPDPWRVIFAHSKIFSGSPSSQGLNDSGGYLLHDDEIIRYAMQTMPKRGVYPGDASNNQVWTVIPTWFASLKGAAGPLSTINNWVALAGAAQPGADLGSLYGVGDQRCLGLYVRVVSRNSGIVSVNVPNQKYYVVGSSYVSPGARSSSNSSGITLDKQYPSSIRGPGTEGGDIVQISGRAQLGTDEDSHLPDSPVLGYPIALTTPPPTTGLSNLAHLKCFGASLGKYMSIKDALKFTCVASGVLTPSFYNLYSHSGSVSSSVSTSITDANFVAEFSLASLGSNYFGISFRNYELRIGGQADGSLFVALDAPSSSITPVSGFKVFDSCLIPNFSIGNLQTFGLSGRVIANKSMISVEIEGLPAWTFSLDNYPHLMSELPGNISFRYMNSSGTTVSGGTTVFNLIDLPDEVENLLIEQGQTGEQSIGTILSDRHCWSRPTPGGSIEFGRFQTRQDLGTYSDPIIRDDQSLSIGDSSNHMSVSGAEFGESIDESHAQLYGYRFGMGNNRFLNTTSDSVREAKLLVDLGRESAETRVLAMEFIPHADPHDRISFSYASNGDGPSSALSEWIVSAVSHSGQADGYDTQLTCRRRI